MADLGYGDLMDQEERRLKGDVSTGAADYGAMMDTEAAFQKQRLVSSLLQAKQTNPDQYAKASILAGTIGVPTAAAEGDPEGAQLRLISQQADTLLKNYPVLAKQLSNPDFAKLAHDDAHTLSLVEQVAKSYLGASTRAGLESLIGTAAKLADAFNPFTLSEQEAAVLYKDNPEKLRRVLSEHPATFLTRLARAGQQASEATMQDLTPEAQRDYGDLKYATLDTSKAAYLSPVKMIGDAIQSLPTSLALGVSIYLTKGVASRVEAEALAAGATPEAARGLAIQAATQTMARMGAATEGAAGFGQQAIQTREAAERVKDASVQASPEYKNLIEKGFAPEAARAWLSAVASDQSGLFAGVADALVNFFGGKFLGKVIGEGGSMVPRVARGAGIEAATEFVQSGLEQMSQNAATQQYLDQKQGILDDVLENMVQGFFVGGLTGGAFSVRGRKSVVDTTRDTNALTALGQLREASKLAERDPQTFGDFVQQAAQDGPVQEIYVDARTLLQSGLDVSKLSADTQTQVAQAAQTGGDVAIPIGEYAANVAGTEEGKALLPHLKTSPEAMSQAEAQVFLQENFNAFRAEADKILTGQQDNVELQKQADAVKAHFAEQLAQANRFTPQVNDAYATLMQSFYVTMAQRLGITPVEMLQRYPLRVAAQNVAAENTMDQPAPITVYRGSSFDATRERGLNADQGGPTFFSTEKAGALAYAGNGEKNIIERQIAPRMVFDTTRLEHRDLYERFMQETGHPARYGQTARPFWTAEPALKKWLDEKGQKFDAIMFDENTGVPSIAVYGDNPNILEQGVIPTSDIGHKREKATGRYVGAPDWVGDKPQGLVALRKKLRQLAREGEPGRHWYERSSKAILDMVGGDKVEAEKIVALIALYSPNSTVPANTSMALTAYYQWKAGLPIDAGFGANDRKAENLLRKGEAWKGIKTNSFYQNLMQEIDPSKNEAQNATMDMWMAIAFDYGMKTVDQGPKYMFMQREIQRLAAELKWAPHQVQAAIWVAMKSRVEPIRGEIKTRELKLGIGEIVKKADGSEVYEVKKDRKADHYHLVHEMGMKRALSADAIVQGMRDFGDAIEARFAQVSWEATPGESSGVLPGLLHAPLELKQEYLVDVMKALTDENGRDMLAQAVGLPQGMTLLGFSAWNGDIGAGAQNFIAVPAEGTGAKRRVKEAPRALLNQYAALKGFVMAQDAVIWHQPVYDDAQIRHNGADVLATRALTADEMRVLYDALHAKFDTWDLAPGYTPTGARILNFVEGLDNKKFQAGVLEVLQSLPEEFGGGNLQKMGYRSDGEYIGNNWQENTDGESYRKILETGRPDLLERAEQLRARVQTLNERWEGRLRSNQTVYAQSARPTADERNRGVNAPAVKADGRVELTHWSDKAGLQTLDPAQHGTGLADAASRRKSADPQNWVDRTYFGVNVGKPGGYAPESGLGPHKYTVSIPLERLYDYSLDPNNLRPASVPQGQNASSVYERAIRDAGFAGYWVKHPSLGMVAAVFEPTTPEAQQPTQALEQSARGQISFGPDITQGAAITLLQNADLSTFLHESGHFFLEVITNIASQPEAPVEVRDDLNKIFKWFGVKSKESIGPDGGKVTLSPLENWQQMTLGEKREYHEKFARGFEAYLFEGKSPNLEMQSLFSRFRAWLINVYKSLTQLNVDLTDEVRGVFDRLVAADEQIAAAEGFRGMAPMFKSAAEAKASEAEWQSYVALGADATEDATRALEKRSLADMRWLANARARVLAKLQEEAKAKRDVIEREVTTEVRQQPVYAAQRFLRYGELPDVQRSNAERKAVERIAGAPTKLSLAALKEMYGDGPAAPWRYLPTGEKGLAATDGVHPDQVAAIFGFTSGDELVRKILAAEPESSVIEGMTDQRMLERHGDLVDQADLEKAADKAVHNEARARFIAAELRFLERTMNAREETGATDKSGRPVTVNVLARAAKAFAEQMIARRKVKDLKPAQFLAAETRAAQAALKAKSPAEKAIEKRNQLVNNYAARSSQEAVAEIEKGVRYFKKFDNDGTRKSIDQDYLDQIDQLLERFDFRRASQTQIDQRESLANWIEKQREMGLEPTIDANLQNEAQRQHYTRMTVEEFRGLIDAVKNIEHLGRLKKKLLTAKDQREFQAVVKELSDSIQANAKGTVAERRSSDRGPLVAIGNLFKSFMADHRKFASLAREMDGWKDAGPMWERLVRTMNDAGNYEAVYRERATIKLSELFAPILKEKNLGKKTYFKAVDKTFTREELLGIALNMGNETNRERVLTGEKWTPAQLNAVLDGLTKSDWDFVQSVWDYLESFRPEIAAKTERVTGVAPEWVEPQPVVTKHGVYKGGYYPIKYDPLRSSKAEADTAAEVQRQMERGLYVRAQTRRGHLEERVRSTGRPMRYDLGVVSQHVDQVIHDLAWHEWLIDANRLMRAAAVDGAIRTHYGPEKLRTMKDTLRDIAIGEIAAQTAGDRVLNYLRHGATIVGLGWRLSTALLQPFGLTQSMVRIGSKWVLKGSSHWFGDATSLESSYKKISEKSDFMRLRAKTMQREINEIRNKVAGKDSRIEASYFYMITKMQLVADIPTWWGAYEKAMHENGVNEAKAIALADQAVIDAQGSGQVKDLAQVQRGSAAWKLFTNFYSFFNTTYNLTRESIGRTNFKKPGSVALLAADMALLYTIPALLGTLLKTGLKGDWDDEDKFIRKLIADQLNYLLGTVVVLREVGAAIQAALGQQGGDYQGPASVRFFVAIAKLAKQAEQMEADESFWKALNEVGGLIFHYPAGQINATADGLDALISGDTQNPGVLVTGAPKH